MGKEIAQIAVGHFVVGEAHLPTVFALTDDNGVYQYARHIKGEDPFWKEIPPIPDYSEDESIPS